MHGDMNITATITTNITVHGDVNIALIKGQQSPPQSASAISLSNSFASLCIMLTRCAWNGQLLEITSPDRRYAVQGGGAVQRAGGLGKSPWRSHACPASYHYSRYPSARRSRISSARVSNVCGGRAHGQCPRASGCRSFESEDALSRLNQHDVRLTVAQVHIIPQRDYHSPLQSAQLMFGVS